MADSSRKFEVVADLLEAKKSLLDRPPTPAKIILPELSRSPNDVIRPPKLPAALLSGTEGRSPSLETIRVDLPGADLDDDSREIEPFPSEGHRPEGGTGDHPRCEVAGIDDRAALGGAPSSASLPSKVAVATNGPSSIGEGVAPIRPILNGPIGSFEESARGTERPDEPPTSGVGPETTPPRVPTVGPSSPGRVAGPSGQVNPPPAIGFSGRDGRAASISDQGGVEAVATESVAPPREGAGVGPPEGWGLAGVEGAGPKIIPEAAPADVPPRRATDAAPSMDFVRNPLASVLGQLSAASPAYPGQGSMSPDRDGGVTGPGDLAPGGSPSSQGGASVDLSRTNELLQQLIDAVRRQRGSSLPPGGATVYPER